MPVAMRLIAAFLLFLAVPCSSATDPGAGLRPVTVTATAVALDPADPSREQFGRLRFLGGLRLHSSDPRFGGLSGLRWWNEGLLAVTDGGNWVMLDLAEKNSRLIGVRALAMGLIRGPSREPLRGKAHADAEALDIAGKDLAVAFEREHRIWLYRTPAAGAWGDNFPDQRWLESLPANGGIEALARWGDAWQLYIAEATTPDGRQEALLAAAHGTARTYARVAVPTPPGLRPSDAQALDGANILLLSRLYAPLTGLSAALQLVPVDAAKMALGTPRLLAHFQPPLDTENFEGLAIRREGGRVFVYLVSDDNFSPLQRTLLLKFELLP